jgi:hypothetical protein
VLDIAPRRRVTGEERGQVAVSFAEEYAHGASIRDIAADSGRSFGFVHRILCEAGVTLRPRGGWRWLRPSTETESI